MQRLPNSVAALGQVLYGLLGWLAFALVALLLVVMVALLPRLEQRRAAARWAARLYLLVTATRTHVTGLEHLPPEPCIVVANHASYMDGLVLTAALPPRFSFVIKREMTRVPVAHFLLRRIGSQFVERFDTRRGAADARRILSLAESRTDLAFFPEGTFRSEPGLRRFQGGAFAAAVRGRVPVVPVVILGTRHMLSADRVLPRHSRLEVIVKPPLHHNGEDDAADTLRQTSRSSILENLREPDMVGHKA